MEPREKRSVVVPQRYRETPEEPMRFKPSPPREGEAKIREFAGIIKKGTPGYKDSDNDDLIYVTWKDDFNDDDARFMPATVLREDGYGEEIDYFYKKMRSMWELTGALGFYFTSDLRLIVEYGNNPACRLPIRIADLVHAGDRIRRRRREIEEKQKLLAARQEEEEQQNEEEEQQNEDEEDGAEAEDGEGEIEVKLGRRARTTTTMTTITTTTTTVDALSPPSSKDQPLTPIAAGTVRSLSKEFDEARDAKAKPKKAKAKAKKKAKRAAASRSTDESAAPASDEPRTASPSSSPRGEEAHRTLGVPRAHSSPLMGESENEEDDGPLDSTLVVVRDESPSTGTTPAKRGETPARHRSPAIVITLPRAATPLPGRDDVPAVRSPAVRAATPLSGRDDVPAVRSPVVRATASEPRARTPAVRSPAVPATEDASAEATNEPQSLEDIVPPLVESPVAPLPASVAGDATKEASDASRSEDIQSSASQATAENATTGEEPAATPAPRKRGRPKKTEGSQASGAAREPEPAARAPDDDSVRPQKRRAATAAMHATAKQLESVRKTKK